jgi:hypothetical protein
LYGRGDRNKVPEIVPLSLICNFVALLSDTAFSTTTLDTIVPKFEFSERSFPYLLPCYQMAFSIKNLKNKKPDKFEKWPFHDP